MRSSRFFQYDRLSNERCTRIIEILPAERSSPVKIRLREMSMDNPSPYEALSYTWDGQTPDRPIDCNGKTLLITENLNKAIRALRKRRESRILWADAICINQSSDTEKAIQVAFMADVYRNARQVLAWLTRKGLPKGKYGTRTSLFIEPLYPGYRRSLLFNLFSRRDRGSVSRIMEEFFLEEEDLMVSETDYWRRAWTVQEFVMNDRCLIFTSSGWGMPKDLILPGAQRHKFNREAVSMHILKWSESKVIPLLNQVYYLFEKLPYLQSQIPHDRVYALKFVWPSLLDGVTIDYRRNPVDTFLEAALSIIVATDRLDILSYACQAEKLEGCPSWVPDWTSDSCPLPLGGTFLRSKNDPLPRGFDNEDTYDTCPVDPRGPKMRASGFSEAFFDFGDEPGILRVKGVCVGVVSRAISSIIPNTKRFRHFRMPDIEALAITYLEVRDRFFSLCKNLFGVARVQEELLRCLRWFRPFFDSQFISQYKREVSSRSFEFTDNNTGSLKKWVDYSVIPKGNCRKHLELTKDSICFGDLDLRYTRQWDLKLTDRAFRLIVAAQRLFMTTDGVFGICERVAPGDKVLLIAGCDKPFIVREATDTEQPGMYRLVGEAYLNGMQNGAHWPNSEDDVTEICLI